MQLLEWANILTNVNVNHISLLCVSVSCFCLNNFDLFSLHC